MGRTKVFFDTEFTGLHKDTTLISIGLVSECGKTFYAEMVDYDKTQIDGWIEDNVIRNLYLDEVGIGENNSSIYRGNLKGCRIKLENWFKQFGEVEMWGDCVAYDWVLFCNIFEHAFNIPKNVYYIPFDICTSFKELGIDPDISREEFVDNSVQVDTFEHWGDNAKHNALWDAYIIRECYNNLDEIRHN